MDVDFFDRRQALNRLHSGRWKKMCSKDPIQVGCVWWLNSAGICYYTDQRGHIHKSKNIGCGPFYELEDE